MNKLLFLFLFFAIGTLHSFGQGSYSVFPNDEEYSLTDDVNFMGALGDRLIYIDRRSGTDRLWVSDGTQDGTYKVQTAERIYLVQQSDSIWYFNLYFLNGTGRLVSLEEDSEQLTTIYSDDEYMFAAHMWQGDIYFSQYRPGAIYLAKYNMQTNSVKRLYTANDLSIRGIGSNDNYVYFIASKSDGKFLGRTTGNAVDVEVDMQLFPPMDDYIDQIHFISNGSGVYFFYHPEKKPYNIYYMNDTMSFPTVLDTAISNTVLTSGQFDNKFYCRVIHKAEFGFYFKLMITDGTVAGTKYATVFGDDDMSPRGFKQFNDRMYFHYHRSNWGIASLGPDEDELTIEFTPFGHHDGYVGDVRESVVYQDSLLVNNGFNAEDAELYVSDGHEESLQLLTDVVVGAKSYPQELTVVGDRIFFTAKKNDIRQLYVYDPDYTVSVVDLARDKSINVYPNPSSGELYLDADVRGKYDKLTIFDHTGKSVLQVNLKGADASISLQGLLSGMYSAVFSNALEAAHSTIIIQK